MEYFGNIIYDDKLLEENVEFVIYGAGKYGKWVLEYLEMNNKRESILCFCDESINGLERMEEGVPVVSPDKAFRLYLDAHFLVCGKYAEEMLKKCIENDVKNIHFLFI